MFPSIERNCPSWLYAAKMYGWGVIFQGKGWSMFILYAGNQKKNNNASTLQSLTTCRGLQFPQRMNDLVESLSIYSGLILNVKKDSSLFDFCRALLHLFPICVLSNMTSGLV